MRGGTVRSTTGFSSQFRHREVNFTWMRGTKLVGGRKGLRKPAAVGAAEGAEVGAEEGASLRQMRRLSEHERAGPLYCKGGTG